ncbi:MAG: protein SCO1/2 [Limisphaerales bacterium]|jgi:protein SCO1/2
MIKLLFFSSILFVFSCGVNSSDQETTVQVKGVKTLPFYGEATFTPKWIEPGSEELSYFHKIPDFELYNQNGDTVRAATFDDKIYIADFFFTYCSGICPEMTTNMAGLQKEFETNDNVLLLSHTVTPLTDSIEVLKAYSNAHGVNDEKWHLVTGDRKQIYNLGRNYYFVEEDLGIDKRANDFLHTENFVLIDKNRHIRGIYNGLNSASIAQLVDDVNKLLEEG